MPIAGGQSLLAGLNMRLSAPKLLVDIGDLNELMGESKSDASIRLGALTRHRELLHSELVKEHVPLLRLAASHIGHVAIRNRGTLGGSLAYADPAAELPACAVALGATLVLGSLEGERTVKAEDFFRGLFETDLKPGELIIAVNFRLMQTGTAIGFAELARRHGDFALVGIAAVASMQRNRIGRRTRTFRPRNARIAYFGCVERARLARSVSLPPLKGLRYYRSPTPPRSKRQSGWTSRRSTQAVAATPAPSCSLIDGRRRGCSRGRVISATVTLHRRTESAWRTELFQSHVDATSCRPPTVARDRVRQHGMQYRVDAGRPHGGECRFVKHSHRRAHSPPRAQTPAQRARMLHR